jgi:hypothetical protein
MDVLLNKETGKLKGAPPLREKARIPLTLHGDEWSMLVWVTWAIHVSE